MSAMMKTVATLALLTGFATLSAAQASGSAKQTFGSRLDLQHQRLATLRPKCGIWLRWWRGMHVL